jgi:hypothetical protein
MNQNAGTFGENIIFVSISDCGNICHVNGKKESQLHNYLRFSSWNAILLATSGEFSFFNCCIRLRYWMRALLDAGFIGEEIDKCKLGSKNFLHTY